MLPSGESLLSLLSANYIIACGNNSILHLKTVSSVKCKHTFFPFDLHKEKAKLPLPSLFYT